MQNTTIRLINENKREIMTPRFYVKTLQIKEKPRPERSNEYHYSKDFTLVCLSKTPKTTTYSKEITLFWFFHLTTIPLTLSIFPHRLFSSVMPYSSFLSFVIFFLVYFEMSKSSLFIGKSTPNDVTNDITRNTRF